MGTHKKHLRKGLFMSTYEYVECILYGETRKLPGPSCSKLTMSLVKDSLKFTSSDTQIC